MRKTVKLNKLVDFVNRFNKASPDNAKQNREAYNMLIESLLLDAGVYDGFSYLTEDELSGDAMSVGVKIENGEPNFDDTDFTRVSYKVHEYLK